MCHRLTCTLLVAGASFLAAVPLVRANFATVETAVKTCPVGTININGVPYRYGGNLCLDGEDCGFTVAVNTETGKITVESTCN